MTPAPAYRSRADAGDDHGQPVRSGRRRRRAARTTGRRRAAARSGRRRSQARPRSRPCRGSRGCGAPPTSRAKSTASDALSHGAQTGAHSTSTGTPGPVSASPGWKTRVSPGRDEVARVVEARQLGMDHRVQLPDRPHRQPGVDLLPRRRRPEPLGQVGCVLADPRGHRLDGEDRRVGRSQVVGQVVVGVLVGDEHRGGAVDCLRLGPLARIDHQRRAVVLEPDARVSELRDPHSANLRRP